MTKYIALGIALLAMALFVNGVRAENTVITGTYGVLQDVYVQNDTGASTNSNFLYIGSVPTSNFTSVIKISINDSLVNSSMDISDAKIVFKYENSAILNKLNASIWCSQNQTWRDSSMDWRAFEQGIRSQTQNLTFIELNDTVLTNSPYLTFNVTNCLIEKKFGVGLENLTFIVNSSYNPQPGTTDYYSSVGAVPFFINITYTLNTNISSCRKLTTNGGYYEITKDIHADISPCISIDADNITLDGKNHFIEGHAAAMLINISGRINITVKNLRLNWTGATSTTFPISIGQDVSSNSILIDNVNVSSKNQYGILLYCGSATHQNTTKIVVRNSNLSALYPTYFYSLDNVCTIRDVLFVNNYINNCTKCIYKAEGASDFFYNFSFINNLIISETKEFTTFTDDYAKSFNFSNGTIGNYWGNTTHTAYSDVCVDADWNGICDSPYKIISTLTFNNYDYLPKSVLSFELGSQPWFSTYIFSPTNTTYYSNIINLDVDSNGTYVEDTWQYNLNGSSNITFTPNTTLTLPIGKFYLQVWMNFTNGLTQQNNVSFSTSVYINLLSPTNTTYYNNYSIPLVVISNLISAQWYYDLNNNGNTSFIPNTTINVIDGFNFVRVWARDATGVWFTNITYFTVTSVCSVTTVGQTKCTPDEDSFVFCKQLGLNIYQWDYTNKTLCTYGCLSGSCLVPTKTCRDRCVYGETICADSNSLVNCSINPTTGCYDWINKTTCPNGCEGDQCNKGVNLCQPYTTKCKDAKYIVWCLDENRDGIYSWSEHNISSCAFQCIENMTATSVTAYCTSHSLTDEAYSLKNIWMYFSGMTAYATEGNPRLLMTISLVIMLAMTFLFGWLTKSWVVGGIAGIISLIALSSVGWFPWTLSVIVLLILFGLIYYMGRREE